MSNYPIFFLHFPRTAGTTIDDIFFNNYAPEEIIRIYAKDEFEKYRFLDKDQFAHIKYITGHLLLTSVNPTRFYDKQVRAFTFLRDPVKRLHSEYLFLKTWKNQHLYNYLNDNEISFSQYITSQEKLLKYRGKNFMTRCISGDSLETSDLDESLQKAKYVLKNNFMFVGIQERFMESLLMLAQEVNLQNIIHQKRNSLNYNIVKNELTEAEKNLVKEYNKADIELYDYALELFEERIKEKGQKFQNDLKDFIFINSKYQKISNLLYQKANKAAPASINLAKDEKW